MRSKTLSCKLTLFCNDLRRYWLLWAIYLAVWVFTLLIPMRMAQQNGSISNAVLTGEYMLQMAYIIGIVTSCVGSIMVSMAMFGHLYTGRNANMMAALPLRREGQFLSHFSAGLVGMLAVDAVVFLLSILVQAIGGVMAVGYDLQWLAIVVLMNVGFYGTAVLVAQLTGNMIVLPILYAVLHFIVVAVETMVRLLICQFVYGMSFTTNMAFQWGSPVIKMITDCGVNQNFGENGLHSVKFFGWKVLAVYAVVGVICTVAAMVLYRRRRMESAGDTVAWKCLRPVTMVLCAVCGMLAISNLLMGITQSASFPAIVVYSIIGCFLGWFLSGAVIQKSFRRFGKKHLLGFGIVTAACLVILGAWRGDAFGYARYIPAENKVESASVEVYGESSTLSSQEGIAAVRALHQACLDNRASAELGTYGETYYNTDVEDLLLADSETQSLRVTLVYTLESGRKVERVYSFPALTREQTLGKDSIGARVDAAMNCAEAIQARKSTDIPITKESISTAEVYFWEPVQDTESDGGYDSESYLSLDTQDAWELYQNAIQPELQNGTLARWWFFEGDDYSEKVAPVRVLLELRKSTRDGTDYDYEQVSYVINLDATKTCKWLREHGVKIYSVAQQREYLDKIANGESVDDYFAKDKTAEETVSAAESTETESPATEQ